MSENIKEKVSNNFIHQMIDKDLEEKKYSEKVHTRFPPEPNGYLHIGHAKAICINFETAKKYQGLCNLRFDDTNPVKEETEFVEAIKKDIEWLGYKWDGLYFASDYFGKMYDFAIRLINKGLAYVDDSTPEEIRELRGDFNTPGRPSPFRDRPAEESVDLFERMKKGEFPDGSKVLRAKIDYNSPNLNMRDPVIYRISHNHHHRTGDEWCIYPMYDYAHPIEDAIEGVTHSLCSLEFEDHRPLYDWVLREIAEWVEPPRQIEFARLNLTRTLMSKRYLRDLVETNKVDGWDDPRMPTLSGLRRRGFTPESVKNFANSVGVSKSNSLVDVEMLEHFVRDDLKLKAKRKMAVLNPLKLVITNYPEGQIEYVESENNPEVPEMGSRQIPFGREIYVEREDFMENPPKKYFRLFPGNEVRLRHAYFVKCNEVIKDEEGNVIELRCTYDPETKSGSGFTGRKVKGTLHWVHASENIPAKVRLYDYLMNDTEEGSQEFNEDSLEVVNSFLEKSFEESKPGDKFQFLRHGYFCEDLKDSSDELKVFNRVVSLKSSWKKK
ncbi:MAG: glutamine--tRNA ligase/YqeY domain fusion protein [Firmicutes bacterium]|jgi:glutaminyl-tRNA synthetase|nr:glutamine--tRNA ligase/YqeY domain fusion protein [Bacillota bacterium]